MSLLLKRLRIKYFGCIHEVTLPSFSRINIFIGPNNSGKSTALRAIRAFITGECGQSDAHRAPTPHLPIELEGIFEITTPALRTDINAWLASCGVNEIDAEACNRYLRSFRMTRKLASNSNKPNTAIENSMQGHILEAGELNTWNLLRHSGPSSRINDIAPRITQAIPVEMNVACSGSQCLSVPSKRIGGTFSSFGPRVNMETTVGQLFSSWRDSDFKRGMDRILNQVPSLDESFAKHDVRADGTLVSELGNEEDRASTIELQSKGLGEQDIYEIVGRLITHNGPTAFALLDEPENSKHPLLQRATLDWLRKSFRNTQLFIGTNSLIFAQPSEETHVFVMARDHIPTLVFPQDKPSRESMKSIRDSIGSTNMDLLGYNQVLFVEGDTEERFLRRLIKLNPSAEWASGFRLINLGGETNLKYERLKEFLSFLKDTWVDAFIWLDANERVIKERENILKAFAGHSQAKTAAWLTGEHFCIWQKDGLSTVDFEDTFPAPLLIKAFLKLIGSIAIDSAALEKALAGGAVKALSAAYAQAFQVSPKDFPKPQFGELLADVVRKELTNSQTLAETIQPVKLIKRIAPSLFANALPMP